jgi:hypothetical protein
MLRLFKAVRFQIFRIRTTTSQESAGSIGRLWNALTSSSLSNSWSHQPQIAHAELSEGATPSSNIVDLMDWFDGFLHMGVPKSKVGVLLIFPSIFLHELSIYLLFRYPHLGNV